MSKNFGVLNFTLSLLGLKKRGSLLDEIKKVR